MLECVAYEQELSVYDGPMKLMWAYTAHHKYAIFYYGSNHSRITYHFRNVSRI